ncbi:hypothetical protein [Streptomyces lonarensis]|uniref:DUF8017 domain-containing protein n=1 Tax=Streptomyces lonarensis TaxID=700599 RepID=A0A7X6CY12_9ACTN|nr:hypothetical protein [Streptomyces lonarensis]NJQ04638.1 hypothetical protein [Streptomyces lonarensis]
MTEGPNHTPPSGGPYGRPEYSGHPGPDATLVPAAENAKSGRGLSHGAKMALAVVAAVAMVAGTTVAGVLLTGDSDGGGTTVAGPGDGDSGDEGAAGAGDGEEPAEDEPEEEPDGEEDGGDDPRGGTGPVTDPVVDDDWQVQALLDRDLAYDVPSGDEWLVADPESYVQWRPVVVNEDGEEEELLYVARGAAVLHEGICGGSSSRGVLAATGARGASGTAEAAESQALEYARAVYDPTFTGELEISDAEPFSNDQGFEGHIAVGELTGFELTDEQDPECYATNATVVSIAYLDSAHDVQVWLAILDADVEDALDEETLDKITNSLRLVN